MFLTFFFVIFEGFLMIKSVVINSILMIFYVIINVALSYNHIYELKIPEAQTVI